MLFFSEKMNISLCIVLNPGRSTRDPAGPGLEPGQVEEKTGEGKT
jgi:hypothetical protein